MDDQFDTALKALVMEQNRLGIGGLILTRNAANGRVEVSTLSVAAGADHSRAPYAVFDRNGEMTKPVRG